MERAREDSAYAKTLSVYVAEKVVSVDGVARAGTGARGFRNAKKILELAGVL